MKQVEVVAAIVLEEGKVLATQRGYGELAGGWEFPGGKVEPGETPEQALVREISEELDADIVVEAHFMDVDYDYETFHLHMRCYTCKPLSGFKLREHRAMRWVDSSDIDELAWLPADVQVVEQVKCRLL